jgi:hypothetical protein
MWICTCHDHQIRDGPAVEAKRRISMMKIKSAAGRVGVVAPERPNWFVEYGLLCALGVAATTRARSKTHLMDSQDGQGGTRRNG